MKIGMLTYHRAHNYGGVLQCYALQKAIMELGYAVEVIDYECEFFTKQYKKLSIFNLPPLKKALSILIHNGNVKYNGDSFRSFVKNNIKLTKFSYSRETIKSADETFDAILTGSDQVWSPFCSGFDKTYFLDFVNKSRKCAYSASFGVETLPTEVLNDYEELLTDFNGVSLREESGAKLFKMLTNRDEQVTLDPTLLLEKDKWKPLLNNKFSNKKYLLVYMIAESSKTLKLAKNLAKQKGLEVFYISDRLFTRNGVTTLSKLGVEEWLSLFYYADCVVTNSFHGVAFSINFEKNFYVQFLPGNAKTNTRISNILSTFDLKDRFISPEIVDLKYSPIENFSEIQDKLTSLRHESIDKLSSLFR